MNPQFAELSSRLSKLPFYLSHPQDNPQIATIALGIVVALGLIAVALLLLLYLQFSKRKQVSKKRSTKRPQRPSTAPQGKLLRIIKWSLVAAVLGVAFSTGPYSVTQPRFCLACHTSKTAYDSWNDSAHRKVGCLACHKSPGSLGTIELAAQGTGNVISSILRTKGTNGGALVRTAACLRCHSDAVKGTMIANGIRVSHTEFLNSIPACTSCHKRSGHNRPDTSGSGSDSAGHTTSVSKLASGSVMNRCISCHDGKLAFARCSGCHAKDIGQQSRIDPADMPKISLKRPDLCFGCHQKEINDLRAKAAKSAFPLVERVCTQCHTLDRLATSGIKGEGWSPLLRRMQLKGADFGQEDALKILNYLQITYQGS